MQLGPFQSRCFVGIKLACNAFLWTMRGYSRLQEPRAGEETATWLKHNTPGETASKCPKNGNNSIDQLSTLSRPCPYNVDHLWSMGMEAHFTIPAELPCLLCHLVGSSLKTSFLYCVCFSFCVAAIFKPSVKPTACRRRRLWLLPRVRCTLANMAILANPIDFSDW